MDRIVQKRISTERADIFVAFPGKELFHVGEGSFEVSVRRFIKSSIPRADTTSGEWVTFADLHLECQIEFYKLDPDNLSRFEARLARIENIGITTRVQVKAQERWAKELISFEGPVFFKTAVKFEGELNDISSNNTVSKLTLPGTYACDDRTKAFTIVTPTRTFSSGTEDEPV